jgi:hypothetical protein
VTYGEFPSLFQGFPPDEPVDLRSLRTEWTIFARGDKGARERLIPADPPRYDPDQAREESWRLVERLEEVPGVRELGASCQDVERIPASGEQTGGGDRRRAAITYGQFPRMFAGFPSEAPVDLSDFRTMLALIRHADEEVKDRLLDRELLARHQDAMMAKDEARELLRRIEAREEDMDDALRRRGSGR